MGTTRSTGFTILRGALYSAAFVWLWTSLALGVRALDPRFSTLPPTWLRVPGLVLACAGALLTGWCILTFVTRGRGTPAPFDPPRVFVVAGPYRYVRNPMYIGATALMLGAGLAVASPSIMLLACGFVVVMHLFVVLHEEPALGRTFGEDYRQYCASVHRWRIRRPRTR